MIFGLGRCGWLGLCLAVWSVSGSPAHSQVPTAPAAPAAPAVAKSPVDAFRDLLAMNAVDREQALATRPAPVRAQIEQKINDYLAMKPGDREARLRATQLLWYAEVFTLTPAADRASQLAAVPSPFREFLRARLEQFDRLPATVQKEILAHESTRAYFFGETSASNSNPALVPTLPASIGALGRMPALQRQSIYAGFRHFFDLSDSDRAAVLDTLPPPERQRVEKTLQTLERLPQAQRDQGLASLEKLASLTDEQRRVLLLNLARWKEMKPEERQAWLKLNSYLPPIPPGLIPVPPSLMPPQNLPVATNPPAP